MSGKTKGVIIFLALIIVAIAIFLVQSYGFNKGGNTANNAINNAVNQTNNVTKNEVENTNNTTNQNNVVNTVVGNDITENTVPDKPVVASNTTSETQQDNDEDKAIAIVKKDWGNTEGYAFKVEQINNDGTYVISVRNEDTVALEWYTVNPKSGQFSK